MATNLNYQKLSKQYKINRMVNQGLFENHASDRRGTQQIGHSGVKIGSSKTPIREHIIVFGKHKGKKIGWIIDNDNNYYRWLVRKGII